MTFFDFLANHMDDENYNVNPNCRRNPYVAPTRDEERKEMD